MSSPADITSTQADLTAVPTAPFSRRVLALLADLLILVLVGIISVWQLGLRLLDNYSDIPELALAWVFAAAVPAAIVAILVIDAVRIGQTPGMAAVGIRSIFDGTTKRVLPTSDPRVPEPGIPALWRDVRILRLAAQLLAVIVVVALIRWMFHNLIVSMDEIGLPKGFDFLDSPYGVALRDAHGFDVRDPVWRGLLIGLQNTLVASVVGIFIATVVGLFVGIARLSSNWLVAKGASLYVESLRNIPPLVVIVFFGFALFTFGPFPRFNPTSPPWQGTFFGSDSNWIIVSRDRWAIPSLASESNVGIFWLFVLAAAVVAVAVWQWRTRRNNATGEPHHRVLWSLGVFTVIVVVCFAALGGPYSWSWPAVSENGRRVVGGFSTNSGYMALTLGLGLYTASFVAEIIRGSILAVPKGQTEAATSVALKSGQRYRHVVLPQAQRIAIPPYISECANLIKNTSLGLAVAYPDLFLVAVTAWGINFPAPQLILIIMIVYLTINLIVSALLNVYNRSIQLKER
ncbi:MAG: ABC transporter permease subunit [Acidimicrobiia bacterium]|nr:ABC transporter permease subunit [Acidimicrobiia bacterium]MXZ78146.1 ABC transporter permease subunit [Acidimicrobiia bacterium]MYB10576.1 ABC transporter permease subunit [Acidimicrobiia bacterium]MYB73874.1 ABC transporter permease subunit [Acidimicrobiia bacterium]MYE72164.1 ABC transporter permease subunit [Acidimicrobiia bacterium]